MSDSDEGFDLYLEAYCKKHKITREEALKHKLVQEVKKYRDDYRPLYEGRGKS